MQQSQFSSYFIVLFFLFLYPLNVMSIAGILNLTFFSNENDEHFPVQNVLFLTNRLYQESSVLVSTERGKIEFWPVFGVTKPSGNYRLM